MTTTPGEDVQFLRCPNLDRYYRLTDSEMKLLDNFTAPADMHWGPTENDGYQYLYPNEPGKEVSDARIPRSDDPDPRP